MHFLPVFELTSDNLSDIEVEQHQCPLHQLILLIRYYPKTNPWKFQEKKIENGGRWKSQFFESAILIFFASSPWKSVNNYRLARMGRNFDDYPGFQPKTTFLYYYAHHCTSVLKRVGWTNMLQPFIKAKSHLNVTCSTNVELKNHVASVHEGIKTFKSENCNYRSTLKHNLKKETCF